MVNKKPVPGKSVLENLRYLAAGGPRYDECTSLSRLILEELGIEDELNGRQCEWLVSEALKKVIGHERDRAVGAGAPSIARGAVINRESGKQDPRPFVVAAAGELLDFTDESAFNMVRLALGIGDEAWGKLLAKHEVRDGANQNKRFRQLCAGLWLGELEGKNYSYKRASTREDELLEAVESAIVSYFEGEYNEQEKQMLAEGVSAYTSRPSASNSSAVADVSSEVQLSAFEAPEMRDNANVAYMESESTSSDFLDYSGSKSYRNAPQRPTPPDPNLCSVIDTLARSVRQQWLDEKKYREQRLLLPVCWVNAPEEYSDHQINIIGNDFEGQFIIDGDLSKIVDTFDSVPSGRLMVLGQGGAGKTTLAIELLTGLLDPGRYQPGMLIPIILSAASWNPDKNSLRGWVAATLTSEYLTASKIFRRKRKHKALGKHLVEQRLILPILDGFDEIDPELRTTAIRELNRYAGPIVVTSRRREYFDAVDEIGVLKQTAVVELQKLALKDVTRFLHRTSRPLSDGTTKWTLVFSRASETRSTVLSGVFSTPLMVSLAGTIYGGASINDPAELLDEDRFPDAVSISDYLLDSFVAGRYLDVPEDDCGIRKISWPVDESERWLGFLAAHRHVKLSQGIDWLDLGGFSLDRQNKVVAAILSCVSMGLIILGNHRPGWIALSGLALGIVAWNRFLLGAWPRKIVDWKTIRQNSTLRAAIAFLVLATFFIVPFGAKAASAPLGPFEGSGKATNMDALLFVLMPWLYCLSVTVAMEAPRTTSPLRSVVRFDQIATLAQGAIYGVLAASAPIVWALLGASSISWGSILIPISVSLSAQWLSSSSGRWKLFSAWHAFNGSLPWMLISFLEDAYERGIFRRVGSIYQFRHGTLEGRLARNYLAKQTQGVAQDSSRPDLAAREK